MENHGVQYKTRFRQMREHVLAMKAVWTEAAGAFHGEFVKFDPVWSYPKPLQKPHPPILLGGESDHTLKRIVEYCDGWLPRPRPGVDLLDGVAKLRRMAGEAGRKPQSILVTVFSAPPDPATLASYEKAGIERASFGLPDAGRDEILRKLDEWAPLAQQRKAA
jgi:alkanesulfonate monooxygenase SsuD/methylene tetrahydromethanopterin reductase-like flavin-dependent oxidoreductase (luciferase family)